MLRSAVVLLCIVIGVSFSAASAASREAELEGRLAELQSQVEKLQLEITHTKGNCPPPPEATESCTSCEPDHDISDLIRKHTPKARPPLSYTPAVHQAFEVPIVQVHLRSMYDQQTVDNINSHLHQIVMREYSKIMQENPALQDGGTAVLDSSLVNDLLYLWHKFPNRRRRVPGCDNCTKSGMQYLYNDPEFGKLNEAIQQIADSFLHHYHLQDLVKARNRTLQEAWATVHHHGIGHRTHTHPDAMLSGVYYVRVPKSAGTIRFQDPRGGGFLLPPFEQGFRISPSEGDVLLFPAWLAHEVEPTQGNDARISIAFNLPGKWEDVALLQPYSTELPLLNSKDQT